MGRRVCSDEAKWQKPLRNSSYAGERATAQETASRTRRPTANPHEAYATRARGPSRQQAALIVRERRFRVVLYGTRQLLWRERGWLRIPLQRVTAVTVVTVRSPCCGARGEPQFTRLSPVLGRWFRPRGVDPPDRVDQLGYGCGQRAACAVGVTAVTSLNLGAAQCVCGGCVRLLPNTPRCATRDLDGTPRFSATPAAKE